MKNFKFELQAKLSDGTDIIFDGDFQVGTAVYVLDADGNKLAAPDGEHELEGGQKFKTENGILTEIVEEAPAETPSENPTTEETLEETPATVEVKMVSDEEFQALVQVVAELKAKMDELMMMKESFELAKEQKLAEIDSTNDNQSVELKESKADQMFRKIEMLRK